MITEKEEINTERHIDKRELGILNIIKYVVLNSFANYGQETHQKDLFLSKDL